MEKLTKEQRKEKEDIVADKKLPEAMRKDAYKALRNDYMNPKKAEDFDPATFDTFEDVDDYNIKKRKRKAPPVRLETMGMFPKEIVVGQLIGEYESKQDLYLTMAYYINNLLDRIEYLEVEVTKLKKK